MAFREVGMVEVKEVLRQWLLGGGYRGIARRVGVDRNTVRRYVAEAKACGLEQGNGVAGLSEERLGSILVALKAPAERSHGESWARCEQEREFISRKLEQGLRLTKIRKLLKRRGLEIPYSTLNRFATVELGFGRGRSTIPVVDGEPGQELQVDTGWMGYLEPDEDGRRRRFRAWIFTAVRSRHRFVHPTFRETTLDAIEACEAAWKFFGGVFRVLVPDNTKAIVIKADPLNPLINQVFLEYAQARGFVIDPARVRKAQDKGRVERAVQPVRDDCFAGESLTCLDDARQLARRWCLDEYGMRRHSTTLRMPLEVFLAEEKDRLLPAPSTPYETPLWCEPKVARDQHAQVAQALYSLPRSFLGKRLTARADRTTVRFYAQGLLVKAHPRQPPGGRSTDPADFPPEKAAYALRDIAFLEAQARRHGAAVGRFAHLLLEGDLPWTRMRRVYKLLSLCRRYGDHRVEAACNRALEVDMLDVWRLKRMLELDPSPGPPESAQPLARVIPLARYLRPPEQYALPLQPDRPHTDDSGETP